MAKNPIITTPYGIANYPHISRPDTEGKFADGKYKTKLNLTKEAMAKFKADFTKAVGSIPKGYKVPWGEKDGQEYVIAKSQYQPKIELVDGARMEEDQYVGGGSTIKLAVEIYDYDKGYSLRLKGVKVKELVSGGGSFFKDDEDEEEGETSGSLDI